LSKINSILRELIDVDAAFCCSLLGIYHVFCKVSDRTFWLRFVDTSICNFTYFATVCCEKSRQSSLDCWSLSNYNRCSL